MDFVNRIDLKLKEKNVKRQAMYDDLNLNHSAVTAWKKRGTIPSGDICLKIANYLNVSVEWLLTGNEPEKTALNIEEKNFLKDYNELKPEQKQSVEVIIKSFKETNKKDEAKEFLKKDFVPDTI